jgi:hypothetical protein
LYDVGRRSGDGPHPSQPLQFTAQCGHPQGADARASRFQRMGVTGDAGSAGAID